MASVDGRGIQSIEVGSRLLEALAAHSGPMMLRDVARKADVSPAQAHAYFVSYKRQQMVEQDDETGLYRLGPFALQLGLARLLLVNPIDIASIAALETTNTIGLTTAVSVWGAYGPTVVSLHEGRDHVLADTRVGTVYSLTGSATGRLYHAYLPPKLISKTVRAQRAEGAQPRFVGGTHDVVTIEHQIDAIRERGYSISLDSPVKGFNGLAAPIFDLSGQLTMAITFIGEVDVLDVGPESEHVREIVSLTQTISSKLGYLGVQPAHAKDLVLEGE